MVISTKNSEKEVKSLGSQREGSGSHITLMKSVCMNYGRTMGTPERQSEM